MDSLVGFQMQQSISQVVDLILELNLHLQHNGCIMHLTVICFQTLDEVMRVHFKSLSSKFYHSCHAWQQKNIHGSFAMNK